MPGGLSRRLKSAFILQAVIATIVIVLGTFVAGSIAVDQVTRRYMREEAATFWRERARNANAQLPHSTMLEAYWTGDPQSAARVPAELRALRPGLSIVGSERQHVQGHDGPRGRPCSV